MTHQEVKNEIAQKSLAVAVKQAMWFELEMTFNAIQRLTGVHMKTVTSHVYAKQGSNVRPWAKRTNEQKREAVELAQKLINIR